MRSIEMYAGRKPETIRRMMSKPSELNATGPVISTDLIPFDLC
jgi:hypothetical protein